MESTLITATRTGLAGAIGADVLAKRGHVDVAIIGAGTQGALQLECLKLVRNISRVAVFDNAPGKAEQFATEQCKRQDFAVSATRTLQDAVAAADIIVTATWARSPFLFPGMVRAGAHITTLGPDEPGKCEVDAELMRASVVVCDDKDLAVEMGAVGGAGLDAEAIHAELGEVIAGRKSGRRATGDITVFASVGLAFQDLVTAWHVYQRAVHEGRGFSIRLLD